MRLQLILLLPLAVLAGCGSQKHAATVDAEIDAQLNADDTSLGNDASNSDPALPIVDNDDIETGESSNAS